MQDYRKLYVYKEANELTLEIYKITKSFPKSEQFGITAQMRRAVTSVGANIAEGAGRKSKREFANFLYSSLGSVNELRHFILLSKDLNYIKGEICNEISNKIDRLGRMLYQFILQVSSKN